MDETQAKRIAYCIKEAFGFDFAIEVVLADANVAKLTRRILEGKRVLAPFVPCTSPTA